MTPPAPRGPGLLTRRPLVCLVTDRWRLSPGASESRQLDDLIRLAEAAAAAEVDLIQIRERDLSARGLATLVTRTVGAVGGASRVVVNDRVDVALTTGAAGVHLREDSCPAARVRACAPEAFLVGQSRHDAAALRADTAIDYAIFGAVWATASKPGARRQAGGDALARAVAVSTPPVLAIGGVTRDRLSEVWRAGAAGVAGIGLFIEAVRSRPDWADGMRRLVREMRSSFDRVEGLV